MLITATMENYMQHEIQNLILRAAKPCYWLLF